MAATWACAPVTTGTTLRGEALDIGVTPRVHRRPLAWPA
jgi:hypothetical protein